MVVPSEADRHLDQLYGDHVHQNDGIHMDRCIKKNDVWQVRWQILVIPTGSRYRAPQGAVGWRFMKFLAEEFRGAREQLWIADCSMVFMG